MKSVLVLGAGSIGATIEYLLSHSGDYRVTLADANPVALEQPGVSNSTSLKCIDVNDSAALQAALAGHFAVINACPFQFTAGIAAAAVQAGVHYLDLTEDIDSSTRVRSLAVAAGSALVPQCGLAPGFISIVTWDLTRQFGSLQDVHMRVGALPRYPSNALKYNLTWSTEGLINEYCKPCEAIVDGQRIEVPALEEIEQFSLDGVTYEAFNTSGGLGSLCETLAGKVRNLNYRTVRYPGHRDVMKLLLQDLRLKERPALMKDILETALPITHQDVVLIFVNVSGIERQHLVQKSYANKIYSQAVDGTFFSAIQLTTAASVCAVLDLLADGQLPRRGLIRQEDIDYRAFISNRFGHVFAQGDDQHCSAMPQAPPTALTAVSGEV